MIVYKGPKVNLQLWPPRCFGAWILINIMDWVQENSWTLHLAGCITVEHFKASCPRPCLFLSPSHSIHLRSLEKPFDPEQNLHTETVIVLLRIRVFLYPCHLQDEEEVMIVCLWNELLASEGNGELNEKPGPIPRPAQTPTFVEIDHYLSGSSGRQIRSWDSLV